MTADSSQINSAASSPPHTLPLADFVAELQSLDIRLALDGERLSVSAPKGALTDVLKAAIRDRKLELIRFLQGAPSAPAPIPAPVPAPVLSASQQRLWFLDRMAPGSPIYNMACTFRLMGIADHVALERALQTIVDRHDVLQTVFEEAGETVRPVLRQAMPFSLPVIDLTAVAVAIRDAEAFRLAGLETQRPFDLAQGPLFRATLYVVSDTESILHIVMHHIVTDARSFGVLQEELGQLYLAYQEGRPSPLAPLSAQYADYAAWHRAWLDDGVLATQLPYWQRVLAGALPVLELPLDRPRPPVQTHHGQVSVFSLPPQLAEQLKRFSDQEDVSLFATLLTAYQVLLARYTGQYDVITGTTVANRSQPAFEHLIGFFVNMLALRTDLSGDPTLREAVQRVQSVVRDGLAHSGVPFDSVVESIQPERSLNRTPVFQTLFMWQDGLQADVDAGGMRIQPIETGTGVSRFDISVEAKEVDGTIQFSVEFNTDLFDLASIERMHQHYQMLLTAIVDDASRRIGDVSFLTDTELEQILVQWNDAAMAFPDTACMHELIDAQAARTPDAEAVRSGDVRLTYRELIARANQLAHRLRALGVTQDTLVGISVDRTPDMVVATLGIWKAGAAYVPLDPSYPRERLTFMAEDAGLVALVTESQYAGVIPGLACPIVYLDRDRDAIAAEPVTPPNVETSSRQLAYVIYTSGSTGKPKGVLLEHRSMVNLMYTMQRAPNFRPTDVLFSVTTLSFDIAGVELHLPLMVGGRVVLAPRAVVADGIELAKALRESGASVMQATPATWRMLLESGWKEGQGLTIYCGGEAMSRSLADAMLATGAEVWNLYGPTETTVYSVGHRVGPTGDPIPIGRPMANTTLYILDDRLQPVPVNVPGELYIGGIGLARGYLNRPDLTAERFLPNPFSETAGERMYRTGDQVRYRADGIVEYLGRLDHQVKVRGFRIELGEIESVLATHPRVQNTVIMAREDTPGDQRLVAYFIATSGEPVTGPALRAWLSERLPSFMVPSAFVELTVFPLTPSGKVDRRALPVPQDSGLGSGAGFVSPRNDIESTVAELWKSILHIERVGTNDSFFDLGGHSLLVVQLQSKIREQFQRDVPLMELFRRPTVEAMADYLAVPDPVSGSASESTSPAAGTSLADRARERAQRQNRAAVKD